MHNIVWKFTELGPTVGKFVDIKFNLCLFLSFVLRNISMRILECPPSDKPGYIDEADQFYTHPSSWLSGHFENTTGYEEVVNLPTHVVLYNVLLPVSQSFISP